MTAHICITSWCPDALVRAEHAAFVADLACTLRDNAIDVSLDAVEGPFENAYMDARANAALRQCDLLWFQRWDTWGPIGQDGKIIYGAAIRALLAQVPGAVTDDDERAAIAAALGSPQACVFSLPIQHHGFGAEGAPLMRLDWREEWVSTHGMSLSRLGEPCRNIIGAEVPTFCLFQGNRVHAYLPEYK